MFSCQLQEEKKIPPIDESMLTNLTDSGNYFNIDMLLSLGDRKWVEFQKCYPDINILSSENRERIFILAVRKGYLLLVEYALRYDVNPSAYNNMALRETALFGHSHIVKRLLQDERFNPINTDEFLYTSNFHGIVSQCYKYKPDDPSTGVSSAFRESSAYGRSDIVDMLIQRGLINQAQQDEAFSFACGCGCVNMVDYFLKNPLINPMMSNGKCLVTACQEGFTGVVRRLLQDPKS